MVLRQLAVLDPEDADRADRVLVDGVVVIHVVLRLRDDAAEVRHEAARARRPRSSAGAPSSGPCADVSDVEEQRGSPRDPRARRGDRAPTWRAASRSVAGGCRARARCASWNSSNSRIGSRANRNRGRCMPSGSPSTRSPFSRRGRRAEPGQPSGRALLQPLLELAPGTARSGAPTSAARGNSAS